MTNQAPGIKDDAQLPAFDLRGALRQTDANGQLC
jgi:hypothetical protein